jgi:23S rRNA (cytidine1920-2'-O)/16S rRNA (cytidine1409-2'-O)-methyltransferase
MKIRLDQFLVEKGMAESREKAKGIILSGNVLNGTESLTKPGLMIDPAIIHVTVREPMKYVSRGGLKLEGFMKELNLDIKGFKCIDLGASTGGFTDYLLQNGVLNVTCVDVGYGILHWKLRNDRRVILFEKTNARSVSEALLGKDFDLAVMDLSFISLKLIVPAALPLIKTGGSVICLVKPQFEAGREHVGKGGVVRSEEIQLKCVSDIATFAGGLNLILNKSAPSCLKGPAGNQEYFLHFFKGIK